MQIVYSDQEPPATIYKAIFLAGPTPRSPDVPSWRPEAIRILEELGFDGVVFVPEFSTGRSQDYNLQVEWEKKCLSMADVILFWVPRELKTMPAFTTNVEFGTWIDSGKVLFGAPEGAPKNTYLKWLYKDRGYGESFTDLHGLCKSSVDRLDTVFGILRQAGERLIPCEFWNHHEFHKWYIGHELVGNFILDAKVLFRWDVGGKLHSFALWVKLYIKGENRIKENEFVVFRPETVSVIAYLPNKQDFMLTQVLFVREFRSAVNNQNTYVVELPGGSGATKHLRQLAAEELQQETGLDIELSRLRDCNQRQVYSTMLGHSAKLFALELTQEEFDNLDFTKTFGVEADTERTSLQSRSLLELLFLPDVDWANLGMVFQGLSEELIKLHPTTFKADLTIPPPVLF